MAEKGDRIPSTSSPDRASSCPRVSSTHMNGDVRSSWSYTRDNDGEVHTPCEPCHMPAGPGAKNGRRQFSSWDGPTGVSRGTTVSLLRDDASPAGTAGNVPSRSRNGC